MAEPSRSWTLDDTTTASNPGQIRLSGVKLRRMRPDLYGLLGFLKSIVPPLSERVYITEQLRFGDSRAAVVVCADPLLVAAYTDELDCIAMLRFSETFVDEYGLRVGSRLLTVNTYEVASVYQDDLILGPNLIKRWSGFHPIIAEFVSDDTIGIEARKAAISESEWNRTRRLGEEYLASKPGVARDGRPGYSFIPAKRQAASA